MFNLILRTAFGLLGCTFLFMLGSKVGRKKLRDGAARFLSDDVRIWKELDSAHERLVEAFSQKKEKSALQVVPHGCKVPSCKCHVQQDQDYCNEFCAGVETSSDLHRCGCGHSDCDLSKQLGNVSTFDQTTCA